MAKFSIITATYNRPQLLERMITSVLEQTFTDWELIIIDDSTNEETKKVMASYANHPKITYLKNDKNSGLPYSRNRGLDVAQGEWITFLDDDDYYASQDSLSQMYTALDTTEIVWGAFNKVQPDGISVTKVLEQKKAYNWTKDFLFGKALRGDSIPVFKRNFIANTRYRGFHRSEWQFWYDLSNKSDYTLFPIDIVIAEYLPDGMSNLGYLNKERIYQGQQFREMIRHTRTWKYLPIITLRYFASFAIVRKIRNLLRGKQTSH